MPSIINQKGSLHLKMSKGIHLKVGRVEREEKNDIIILMQIGNSFNINNTKNEY